MAVFIILATLPLALVGGLWFIDILGFNMSVAVGVGFIALAGVAVEIGVIMIVYLEQSLKRCLAKHHADDNAIDEAELRQAVMDGALLRIRPVIMTVTAIIAGLLPIMMSSGTGAEVMRRIAAPMVGGVGTATVLTLFVLPAAYFLWKKRVLVRG